MPAQWAVLGDHRPAIVKRDLRIRQLGSRRDAHDGATGADAANQQVLRAGAGNPETAEQGIDRPDADDAPAREIGEIPRAASS